MTNFVTHPATQKQVSLLKADLPQSLLLSGVVGVGLLTTAKQLGGKNVTHQLYPKDSRGTRDDAGGVIAVEAIRDLYAQTRSKRKVHQVVIIDDADRMSLGAQAAFLKLLEEPNPSVHFILTSHLPDILLPTIRSRVQQVNLRPLTYQQTIDYIATLKVAGTDHAKLLFVAEGLPAELYRLAHDQAYFQNRAAIMSDAKTLLTAGGYEVLLALQKYLSDRLLVIQLIESALLIARRSLSTHPQPKLVQNVKTLLDIREKLAANHSVRLQLIRTVL